MLDRDLFALAEPELSTPAPAREMRAYQVDGIAQLRDKLRSGLKRIVFYLPTGGGKTEVAGDIFKNAAGKGKRALFVCHRIELVKNASERFTSLGIGHGIIQGENTRSTWQGILVCSIQTLTRRMVEDVDLIIVDEAHRCAASRDYHKLFAKFHDKPIIGLTATPFAKGMARACEGVNGPLFEDMVIAATIPELIRDGFLVDCDIYGPSEPDLSTVKIVAGDYHQEQLGKAVDQPKLVGDIVTHWQKLGRNQQTICFATNVAHSKHITDEFQKAGVAAAHIDAYTPEHERVRIIKAFRTGEVTVLSNVGVLSEGFDCPAAAVMILARPTKSLILYIQMAGRVLRPSAGKKCLARGTLVLTDRGEVEIQNITLDHKLWDGHTFVRHDGAICNGIKRVMSYDGIVATPDHEVMTDEGWQYLAEAHRRGLRITRSGMDGRPLRVLENCLSGSRGGELQSARDGAMWPLQERPHGPISQHAKAPQYRGLSPLQWQGAGNGAALAVSAVPSATIALSEQVRRAISLVRWAWDRVSLRWAERCGAVDSGRSGHCGSLYAVGPHKQQWPLRAWKSSVGGTGPERQQQPTCGQRGETQVPDVQGGPSRGPVRRQNSFAHDPRRVVGRGNTGPMAGPVVQTEGEVWDILNVGPLQRFTANGRLVHNCALILDHSGTARRLGFPTDELPLELDDGKPKVSEGSVRERKEPLPKLCSKCSFLKPAKMHTCPVCGFKPERQSEIESEDGSLQKMGRGPKKDGMSPADKAQFFAELKGLAAEKGKSNGWVLANFKQKTGHWPANKNSIAAAAPSQATRDWVKSRMIARAKSHKSKDAA